MDDSTIPLVPVNALPSPGHPSSYSDDVRLGPYSPSRYTWEGGKRKGIPMHIQDESSIDDHLREAIRAYFFFAKEIPLPQEAMRPIGIVSDPNSQALRAWWEIQLGRVKGIVNDASRLQTIWNNSKHSSIRSATGRIQTVALVFLLMTFDHGGARIGSNNLPTASQSMENLLRKERALATHPVQLRNPSVTSGRVRVGGLLPGPVRPDTFTLRHYWAHPWIMSSWVAG